MSGRCLRVYALIIFLLVLRGGYAEDATKSAAKTGIAASPTITVAGATLTLDQAIDIVLKKNLTLQSARYDVIMSDTGYEAYKKKYSPTLNLEGGYINQTLPPSGSTMFTGTKLYQYDVAASISKAFSSGTRISAGIQEAFFDANDPAFPPYKPQGDPGYNKPALFVSIQQELLKNSFGYTDRLREDILKNSAKMQRAAIVDQLSGLVVSVLADYWTVTVQRSAVENARIELDADRQVRDIIARNARYGLAESYDLNQFNALVAGAETKLEIATQRYRDAVRKLLRTVNMPVDTEVTGVTELVDTLPELDRDVALKAAFLKRVDYRNSLLYLENAKRELSLEENNALPSLTVSMGLNTIGQQEDFPSAFTDAASAKYPAWQARAKLSYPLDDTEQKANLRNAQLKLKQANLNLDNIKLEVRDDVLSRLEQVRLQHTVLTKARIARVESEQYYQKVLVKFRQGKVTSLAMRTALEAMAQSRQQALESLVLYNVTLLQYDLAKNEIFERYHVDVEKYISEAKE